MRHNWLRQHWCMPCNRSKVTRGKIEVCIIEVYAETCKIYTVALQVLRLYDFGLHFGTFGIVGVEVAFPVAVSPLPSIRLVQLVQSLPHNGHCDMILAGSLLLFSFAKW